MTQSGETWPKGRAAFLPERLGAKACIGALALVGWLVASSAAFAQGPEKLAEKAAPAAPATDAKKEEARGYFQKGVTLFEEQAWDAALAEFQRSRETFPTRTATKNTAICLRKLHRFDEALEMYEALLREFPTMSADEKAAATTAVTELKGVVGAIELRGAEPGARIVIDGRERGVYPSPSALKVSAGTHVVRVYKEGFLPYEGRVTVVGGQTKSLDAPLGALTQAGRLRVAEQQGKVLDVVIDGVVVGKTPWEGTLAAGDHTVALRGPGNLGSPPVSAPVRLKQLTPLTIVAEELESTLRIEPTPAGASVAVDGVTMGRGVWEGKLRAGGHRVEVLAEGFRTSMLEVKLGRGERRVLPMELARELRAGGGSKVVLELEGLFTVAPSFGGDLASSCKGSCTASPGLGPMVLLHAGYEFGFGLSFGASVGYASMSQDIRGRRATVTEQGGAAAEVTADDALRLSGVLLGATSGFHVPTKLPLLFRVGAGAFIGSLADDRSGKSFTSSDGGPKVADSSSAVYFYVAPEARVAYRIGSYVEAGIGITGIFLVALDQPEWSNKKEQSIFDGTAFGTFGKQKLLDKSIFGVAPNVGVRVAF